MHLDSAAQLVILLRTLVKLADITKLCGFPPNRTGAALSNCLCRLAELRLFHVQPKLTFPCLVGKEVGTV